MKSLKISVVGVAGTLALVVLRGAFSAPAGCQRRTGSVFGVGAFYKKEHVRAEGPSNIYVRDGQEGRKVRMHFCPTCGTTVFYEADLRPDHIGVAVGRS